MKLLKIVKNHPLGGLGAFIVALFIIVGIYAPLFAASKPLFLYYRGAIYFPLFRYLFFSGYYTKPLDLFFNLLMFTFPFFVMSIRKWSFFFLLAALQGIGFIYLVLIGVQDPASDPLLTEKRVVLVQEELNPKIEDLIPKPPVLSWSQELTLMNSYARLNRVVNSILQKQHHQNLEKYIQTDHLSTRYALQKLHLKEKKQSLQNTLKKDRENYLKAYDFLENFQKICYKECEKNLSKSMKALIREKQGEVIGFEKDLAELQRIDGEEKWAEEESSHIQGMVMPFLRPFHWEEDAGGERVLNQQLPWWELTRNNRKDLTASLIFGVRVSLVVGFLAVFLAFSIGVPVGSLAGYYGGVFDIIVSRLLEIWESMPTFFMLLLAVGILQSKSIFIVILIIGIFGWTSFSRYIRGEFFKQRLLPYVEASRAIGFSDAHIIFRHILPNAIPPLLTLLPFAVMGAISSEAGLSFLGLGEEGSCSWGVLMDEGRNAFPAEAYLLWPPAILLIILLVAIALVGDAMRDILDPKLK